MQLFPQFTSKGNNNYAAEDKPIQQKSMAPYALRHRPKSIEFGVECATPARHPDRQAQSIRTPPLHHRPVNLQ